MVSPCAVQESSQASHVENAELAFLDRVKGPGLATIKQGAQHTHFVHLNFGAFC